MMTPRSCQTVRKLVHGLDQANPKRPFSGKLTEDEEEGEIRLSQDLKDDLHREPKGHHRDKVDSTRGTTRT